MLRSLYAMLDYSIAATDGVEGVVQDFLFDDESWVIHYLVVETPSAMGTRKVLIPPFAVAQPDWETKRLSVHLTSGQVRTAAPLESDLPISRQHERGLKRPGSHLRSFQELLGYIVHTRDGEAGTIEDLIIEDLLWGVHFLVIALKRPLSVLLSPGSVRSISWPGKAAWLNLSLQQVESSTVFDPTAPVNHDREHRLYDYHGRLVTARRIVSQDPQEKEREQTHRY